MPIIMIPLVRRIPPANVQIKAAIKSRLRRDVRGVSNCNSFILYFKFPASPAGGQIQICVITGHSLSLGHFLLKTLQHSNLSSRQCRSYEEI
jgi:hypothetical protein